VISRRLAWLAPLAAVAAAGCFATRNDVRLLQADVTRLAATAEENRRADAERMRLEMARRDSMHATDMRQLFARVNTLSDSLTVLSEYVVRLRANLMQSLHEADERQLTMMDILGASQKTIADMRARVEASQREDRAVSSAPGGADSAGGQTPGPLKMYNIAMEQLQNGAASGARSTFRDFLGLYKTDPLVPDVLYGIGLAYAADKMDSEADSVYRIVVDSFPKSTKAPTALFKRATALASTKPREARALYDRIVAEYPRTMEADLARDRIKHLPPQ
jgi:TolA-binding protein